MYIYSINMDVKYYYQYNYLYNNYYTNKINNIYINCLLYYIVLFFQLTLIRFCLRGCICRFNPSTKRKVG